MMSFPRDNPSLVGRLRPMLLHSQLALPGSPAGSNHSKCSTPAEAEAEEIVCQLSDQVWTEGGRERWHYICMPTNTVTSHTHTRIY